MRLTVVGCAGSFPSATSPASCYLLEHEGSRLLLDLGNGALGALQQHLDLQWPEALDAVILSHCHVDHCVDAASLYVQRRYAPVPTSTRLPMLGPDETRDRLAAIYGMTDPADLEEEFDFSRLAGAPRIVGPFTVQAVRAAHPVDSYSVRISAGGRSLVYSGDTGPNARLTELSRGADVALFEASFVGEGNPADLHMTGADAGRIAMEARVGRLVLTHLVAWNDNEAVLREARAAFDGPIDLAHAGMVIEV